MKEAQLVEIEARLKQHRYGTCGGNGCEGAEWEVTALVAEVRRLRELVHSAWEEAYDAGQRSADGIPKVWLSCDTRKQLGAP